MSMFTSTLGTTAVLVSGLIGVVGGAAWLNGAGAASIPVTAPAPEGTVTLEHLGWAIKGSLYHYRDPVTRCEYFYSMHGGAQPRLNAAGNPYCLGPRT